MCGVKESHPKAANGCSHMLGQAVKVFYLSSYDQTMLLPYPDCSFLIQTLLGRASLSKWVKVKACKVILLHFGELPTTKEPLDKEGAVWIRFPQAREAGDRLVLGIIEVSGYVCCLFFCGWVYLRFSGGNMDMKHKSSGVVKIQEENKWVWPRWVKKALGSCEIWSNQEGAKRKKGRLRRRSKAQIRRGRCWKRSILFGYQGSYGTMKMGREEAQQILMGECSYSAYMGESVESSGVMRKLETKGADERVTKDEWDEFVKYDVTCEKGDGNYEELPALDQTVEGRIRPRLDRLSGQAGEGGTREPGDSKALVTYTAQPSLQNNRENEYLRRSDLDSLIKMLKENGNTLGTLGYSFGASYEPMVTCEKGDGNYEELPALDQTRGNGTESGEQEQNQEDSGLHDQVENNVQSSGEVDEVQSSGEVDEVQSSGEEQVGPASSEDEQVEPAIKAWKVILLHFGELPTTKEPLDKEGAVWIRFPQAREAGDR
ncbi:hypothetical protein IGI04_042271, partial [Brassica rapa subsp. trilocularis]